MIEKCAEYAVEAEVRANGESEQSSWPFAARILDPVRVAVVCQGPAQMLEVAKWFLQAEEDGLEVCRVKNKFGVPQEALVGGYRDLQLCVVFRYYVFNYHYYYYYVVLLVYVFRRLQVQGCLQRTRLYEWINCLDEPACPSALVLGRRENIYPMVFFRSYQARLRSFDRAGGEIP